MLRRRPRRQFFSRCTLGLGGLALASTLSGQRLVGGAPGLALNPTTSKRTHWAPRAKNIIYLFMAGAPSQLEMFDYKPKLIELNGQPIPESFVEGKRFAFMGSTHGQKLLGTRRKFRRHGQAGMWVSELLPPSSHSSKPDTTPSPH